MSQGKVMNAFMSAVQKTARVSFTSWRVYMLSVILALGTLLRTCLISSEKWAAVSSPPNPNMGVDKPVQKATPLLVQPELLRKVVNT